MKAIRRTVFRRFGLGSKYRLDSYKVIWHVYDRLNAVSFNRLVDAISVQVVVTSRGDINEST